MRVQVLRLASHLGFGRAVRAGLEHVVTRLVLVLQHDWLFVKPGFDVSRAVGAMLEQACNETTDRRSATTQLQWLYRRSMNVPQRLGGMCGVGTLSVTYHSRTPSGQVHCKRARLLPHVRAAALAPSSSLCADAAHT